MGLAAEGDRLDAMDPPPPADTETTERDADKDAKRKIQFSVPSSVPIQLDPRQVEMVRDVVVKRVRACACVRVCGKEVKPGSAV